MKVNSIISLAAAAAIVLFATSCNKEENIAKPTVNLTEVGHDNEKVAMRGDDLHLEADILAEGLIQRIDVEIHQESGTFEIEKSYTEGKYIGVKELAYWSMALPLRHIIESKVGKVGNGFYGHFDKMDLFVFSLENLGATEAMKAMNYTLSLQKCLDNRFDRLYLADVDDLFVCNLDDGLKESSRMLRYRISQEQRRDFYQEAVRRQNDCI